MPGLEETLRESLERNDTLIAQHDLHVVKIDQLEQENELLKMKLAAAYDMDISISDNSTIEHLREQLLLKTAQLSELSTELAKSRATNDLLKATVDDLFQKFKEVENEI